MSVSRGLPPPTELSREFWDAAAEHRLVVPRCDKCGQHFFPPERMCPACGSDIWSGVDCAGTGSVVAFTVVHRAPSPDFDVPYVVAVVELAEGCELLTNLVLDEPASAAVGMPVAVAFLDQPDGRALPVFTHQRSAQQEGS